LTTSQLLWLGAARSALWAAAVGWHLLGRTTPPEDTTHSRLTACLVWWLGGPVHGLLHANAPNLGSSQPCVFPCHHVPRRGHGGKGPWLQGLRAAGGQGPSPLAHPTARARDSVGGVCRHLLSRTAMPNQACACHGLCATRLRRWFCTHELWRAQQRPPHAKGPPEGSPVQCMS
jgi:hypothetical protein